MIPKVKTLQVNFESNQVQGLIVYEDGETYEWTTNLPPEHLVSSPYQAVLISQDISTELKKKARQERSW